MSPLKVTRELRRAGRGLAVTSWPNSHMLTPTAAILLLVATAGDVLPNGRRGHGSTGQVAWWETCELGPYSCEVTPRYSKRNITQLLNACALVCSVTFHSIYSLGIKSIHTFISSRIDYGNAILTGIPQKTIKQLQTIPNAAAIGC